MKNNVAKKALASYHILSYLLALLIVIPVSFISKPLWLIVYYVCATVYIFIAARFPEQVTIMPSLLKELDAEKYAAIIASKQFRNRYSLKLLLYFAVGDYQSAFNIISCVLLRHKKIQQRIYGHLLLCRICFERGDYEGIKEQLDQIDNFSKNNPKIKLSKRNKKSYDFYRAFSNADYVSVCALLEKSIAKDSKKKNGAYSSLSRQYMLAVAKRMNGNVDEAIVILENVKEKAPKLVISTLAQKELDIIAGTLEETVPDRLEITEDYPVQSRKKTKNIILLLIYLLLLFIFFLLASGISILPDVPKQKDKDPEYVSMIESTLDDDYEAYQLLGYLAIYTDYADETYEKVADALALVDGNGSLDLHALFETDGVTHNSLMVEDIQIDKLYEYALYLEPLKVEFVLTEKSRNIPENTLYYFELDGYYFCVISISDV